MTPLEIYMVVLLLLLLAPAFFIILGKVFNFYVDKDFKLRHVLYVAIYYALIFYSSPFFIKDEWKVHIPEGAERMCVYVKDGQIINF